MNTSAIVAAVLAAADLYSDRTALIGGDEKIFYAELVRRMQSAAAHIAQHSAGENVGVFLSNSIHFPPHVLGALWAGKTVAVLPTLAPAPLLKLMFAEAQLTTVFTSEDLVPRLVEVGVPYVVVDSAYPPAKDFAPQERSHDAAVLLYTSGTTGRPKAVALSELNIISNAEGCKDATGFDDRQVMLAILPLFHAYGLTVTNLLPLMTGSTVVVLERFMPRSVLSAIERHRVTCLVAVPSQYRLLAIDPTPCDATSLWLCIAGAERLPETTEREFTERFGHPILPGYGATEVAPVISLNIPTSNRPASVGRPLPNLKVTIRSDDDAICPVGEIGEVCVEGSSVMLGYLNDVEATARKIRNHILHTGDKGFFDAEGYLYLAGRADEMVKVGGEKVYPIEVENALERIAGVEEVAVIALPDQKHGARLHAFVQKKEGSGLDESTLRAACRESLEQYKVPRSFTFVDSLPRTITGKTDKRSLTASAGSRIIES
jgi:long-chain acyl-CoA synthetase